MKYILEVPDGSEEIANALAKELGVELKPYTGGARSTCGSGFGDMVWRMNYASNRVEASFAKPCDTSKKLKAAGFRWHHRDGVWYAPNLQYFADVCEKCGLRQEASITAK